MGLKTLNIFKAREKSLLAFSSECLVTLVAGAQPRMEEVSRSKLGLGGGGRVVDARMKVVKKKDETSFETKNKGRGRSEVFANKEGGLVAREKVGGAYPAGVDLPDEAAV